MLNFSPKTKAEMIHNVEFHFAHHDTGLEYDVQATVELIGGVEGVVTELELNGEPSQYLVGIIEERAVEIALNKALSALITEGAFTNVGESA